MQLVKTRPAVGSTPNEAAERFDAVYEQYFEYVFRIVTRLSAGTGDVDDFVQDVFVVVHRRLPTFVGETGMTTWLFQIAHRVVRAHFRKNQVRRLLLAAFQREQAAALPAGQLRTVEAAQECAAVSRAIAGLAWKKRVALLLHVVEEWSCEEIAEKLGVPVGTIHSRVHHARRDVEAILRGERGK